MSTYLTWLADEFRAAGLVVVEYDGWQTRARSTGGFEPGRPLCVMWHHTASETTPENDMQYMLHGSDAKPVANIGVARDGSVHVGAAGATNTNGTGTAQPFSRGTVPADSMNVYALGVEIMNNGVGEPYPQPQIDAAFVVSNVANRRLGNVPADVCTHQTYASGRKIDPATAVAVQGPWRPGSVTSSGSWSLDDLRAECTRRAPGLPAPQPIGEIDMYVIRVIRNGWPGPVDCCVAADGTRWNANGHTSGLDRLAGVPTIEGVGKDQLLGVLHDRGGIGPHPFGSGDYADADLAAAW